MVISFNTVNGKYPTAADVRVIDEKDDVGFNTVNGKYPTAATISHI